MLIYTIFNKKLLKPKACLTKGRCFKKFSEEEFNKDLQLVPFHVAYVFEDMRVDDIYWAWEENSGKVSVDRNLSPQKYVTLLVTGMLLSVNITSQERLTTGRHTGLCVTV